MTQDPFTSAAPKVRAGTGVDSRDPETAQRDGYGRYLVPALPADYRAQFAAQGFAKPDGKPTGKTRATTFAKSISDTFTLSAWSQRMAVKGLAMRPDLIALAAATRVDDKATLDSIVDQAKDAASVRARANLGTAVHSFTEMHDRGEDLSGIPAPFDKDVAAWATALAQHGLVTDESLIERSVLNTRWDVVGTFDRVFRVSPTDAAPVFRIGDLKTGRDLQYGWNEIAIQLAIYATADAIYDWSQGVFLPLPDGLRQDWGVVVHIPAGTGKAEVYRVDLVEAIEAADLCAAVRKWRKTRNLATLLTKVEDEPAAESARPEGPAMVGGQTCPACGEPAAVVDVDNADWACKLCSSWGVDYGVDVAQGHWREHKDADTAAPAQERTTDALGGPLGPLAADGERGCSVCRRKGHKKGSPKCLGDQGPEAGRSPEQRTDSGPTADQTPYCPRSGECTKAGFTQTLDPDTAKPTGIWVCGNCELPASEEAVRATVREATATPAPEADRVASIPIVVDAAVPDGVTVVEDGGDPFADAPMPTPKVKARPPTDLERIQAAGSEGELLKLGTQLKAGGKLTEELKAAAKSRRAKLAEPAG